MLKGILKKFRKEYFVIQSDWSGSSMLFWRKGKAGYTVDFENVHKFTLEEAKKTARSSERIFSWNELNKLTSRVVNSELKREIWKHEIKINK